MARPLYSKVVIKKPTVVHKDLSKEFCVGLSYEDGHLVEIEPKQSDRQYLLSLFHELCHLTFPTLTEKQIIKLENVIGGELWKGVSRLRRKWKKEFKK
jgi:hypothetical protein